MHTWILNNSLDLSQAQTLGATTVFAPFHQWSSTQLLCTYSSWVHWELRTRDTKVNRPWLLPLKSSHPAQGAPGRQVLHLVYLCATIEPQHRASHSIAALLTFIVWIPLKYGSSYFWPRLLSQAKEKPSPNLLWFPHWLKVIFCESNNPENLGIRVRIQASK